MPHIFQSRYSRSQRRNAPIVPLSSHPSTHIYFGSINCCLNQRLVVMGMTVKQLLVLVGFLCPLCPRSPFGFRVANTSRKSKVQFPSTSFTHICMEVINMLWKQEKLSFPIWPHNKFWVHVSQAQGWFESISWIQVDFMSFIRVSNVFKGHSWH